MYIKYGFIGRNIEILYLLRYIFLLLYDDTIIFIRISYIDSLYYIITDIRLAAVLSYHIHTSKKDNYIIILWI